MTGFTTIPEVLDGLHDLSEWLGGREDITEASFFDCSLMIIAYILRSCRQMESVSFECSDETEEEELYLPALKDSLTSHPSLQQVTCSFHRLSTLRAICSGVVTIPNMTDCGLVSLGEAPITQREARCIAQVIMMQSMMKMLLKSLVIETTEAVDILCEGLISSRLNVLAGFLIAIPEASHARFADALTRSNITILQYHGSDDEHVFFTDSLARALTMNTANSIQKLILDGTEQTRQLTSMMQQPNLHLWQINHLEIDVQEWTAEVNTLFAKFVACNAYLKRLTISVLRVGCLTELVTSSAFITAVASGTRSLEAVSFIPCYEIPRGEERNAIDENWYESLCGVLDVNTSRHIHEPVFQAASQKSTNNERILLMVDALVAVDLNVLFEFLRDDSFGTRSILIPQLLRCNGR